MWPQRKSISGRYVIMETTTTDTTGEEKAAIGSGWALARRTTLGIVLMGTLGAVAGFLFARYLWL